MREEEKENDIPAASAVCPACAFCCVDGWRSLPPVGRSRGAQAEEKSGQVGSERPPHDHRRLTLAFYNVLAVSYGTTAVKHTSTGSPIPDTTARRYFPI